MRTLSKIKFAGILFLPAVLAVCMIGSSLANVIDGSPGYPNSWEGMTTNTIIRIDLDRPVAMNGDQPDMDYTVKMAAFDGFDFLSTEVQCDVEVSDDRQTIRLYPQALLEQDGFYAYKFDRIAFADGTQQEYTQCYATGSNPVPLLNTVTSEVDLCNDSGASLADGNWCARCHHEWSQFMTCTPGQE